MPVVIFSRRFKLFVFCFPFFMIKSFKSFALNEALKWIKFTVAYLSTNIISKKISSGDKLCTSGFGFNFGLGCPLEPRVAGIENAAPTQTNHRYRKGFKCTFQMCIFSIPLAKL